MEAWLRADVVQGIQGLRCRPLGRAPDVEVKPRNPNDTPIKQLRHFIHFNGGLGWGL